MNTYSIVLFVHIVGALGFFIVQGLEWMGLSQIRSAKQPAEARAILGLVKRTDRLGAISILTLITTGFYMMLTVWHAVPWILVVLAALVLEILIFVVLNRPRMAAIEQALEAEESSVLNTLHAQVNHPILWLSVYTRTAILLGIVFLKIAKPDLSGSLLTMGIAIALGLALALPELRRERVQAGRGARMMIALLVTVFVAALALLAVNSIRASAISLSITKKSTQGVQTKPTTVLTGIGSSNGTAQAPTPSPDPALQDGQSLLQTRCTQCHSLQKVQQAKKTRSDWAKTLAEMESFGLKINDTEKAILLDYLTNGNNP